MKQVVGGTGTDGETGKPDWPPKTCPQSYSVGRSGLNEVHRDEEMVSAAVARMPLNKGFFLEDSMAGKTELRSHKGLSIMVHDRYLDFFQKETESQ